MHNIATYDRQKKSLTRPTIPQYSGTTATRDGQRFWLKEFCGHQDRDIFEIAPIELVILNYYSKYYKYLD